jgi:acetolactate synthase-1/2/3 large subunit
MKPLEAIVKTIEGLGIDTVFGGSGESDATLLLALKKSKSIRTIMIRNEQAASFMACGYAMFSDKLGVCFSTNGPGAFNLFSGLALALSDSLPVFALSGYVGKDQKGKGALNESSGLSRTPDSLKMFEATCKRSYILEDPFQTCDLVEEAVNVAFEGRPGPVHIHIPEDVTLEGVTAGRYHDVQLNVKPVHPSADQVLQFAQALAQAIAAGKRVAALIGYGAVRSRAAADLRHLLETFQIPFFTTMDAKGILPEDHPLCLGVLGTSGDSGTRAYFAKVDLLLAMGNSFAQNATFKFRPDLFHYKVLMHINIDAQEIGKVYKADYALVSDISHAVRAISKQLERLIGPVNAKTCVGPRVYSTEVIKYSGNKIHPGQLVRVLSDHLPPNSIVLGDAGAHMLWLACYLNLTKGQIYQNPGSFGPMASHVNGAMGVKCAHPDRPVIVGCGDGGYLMGGFELLTAVENKIPIVWIIFNNGEFNIVKYFQHESWGEDAFVAFPNPDYVAYARACGARGYRVERLEDFGDVIDEALNSNAPTLIDAVVDGEVYAPHVLDPWS